MMKARKEEKQVVEDVKRIRSELEKSRGMM